MRTLHPTHSLCVYGPRAQAFAEGQERFDTPCAPGSCYGELLRQNAQVMMVGVTFACNTSVHCIEEIANVPGRLTAEHHPLFVRDQSGRLLSVPSRRHQNANSDHYVKLEPVMFHRNVLRRVPFGNAECLLFRGKDLLAVTLELLKKTRIFSAAARPSRRSGIESAFYRAAKGAPCGADKLIGKKELS